MFGVVCRHSGSVLIEYKFSYFNTRLYLIMKIIGCTDLNFSSFSSCFGFYIYIVFIVVQEYRILSDDHNICNTSFLEIQRDCRSDRSFYSSEIKLDRRIHDHRIRISQFLRIALVFCKRNLLSVLDSVLFFAVPVVVLIVRKIRNLDGKIVIVCDDCYILTCISCIGSRKILYKCYISAVRCRKHKLCFFVSRFQD